LGGCLTEISSCERFADFHQRFSVRERGFFVKRAAISIFGSSRVK
jgi:hypothetical protein